MPEKPNLIELKSPGNLNDNRYSILEENLYDYLDLEPDNIDLYLALIQLRSSRVLFRNYELGKIQDQD